MKILRVDKKGFTLIEMLVVILIIVILITIAVPAVAGYRKDAQETADMAMVNTIYKAIEATAVYVNPSVLTDEVDTKTIFEYWTDRNFNLESPPDDEFSVRLMEHLGAGHEGWFRFGYDQDGVQWVSYWDVEGTPTEEDVMHFHNVFFEGTAYGELGYISDLNEKYGREEFKLFNFGKSPSDYS